MAKDLGEARKKAIKMIEVNFKKINQTKQEYQVKLHKISKVVSHLSDSMDKLAKDQKLFQQINTQPFN